MNTSQVFNASNITKTYKNFTALNNISFSIDKGDIFGLIGENGAGKTTLMKIIAGSIKPSSGKISIMEAYGNHLHLARKNMGIIIENPAYYGDMNALENLEIIRLAKGITDKSIHTDILEMVGLYEVRLRKVKKFSLGMKQRLGLAISLMGFPQFLILDEPTNGLDPNGIIDLRSLINRLNKEYGITLMISSHILSELNQVATRFGILHNGEMVAIHTAQELGTQCQKKIIIKHKDDSQRIAKFLNSQNIVNFCIETNKIIINEYSVPQNFLLQLVNEQFKITEYYTQQESLEDYFVGLTQRKIVI